MTHNRFPTDFAFVIQFAHPGGDQRPGRVEHISSGSAARFQDGTQLMTFANEVLASLTGDEAPAGQCSVSRSWTSPRTQPPGALCPAPWRAKSPTLAPTVSGSECSLVASYPARGRDVLAMTGRQVNRYFEIAIVVLLGATAGGLSPRTAGGGCEAA